MYQPQGGHIQRKQPQTHKQTQTKTNKETNKQTLQPQCSSNNGDTIQPNYNPQFFITPSRGNDQRRRQQGSSAKSPNSIGNGISSKCPSTKTIIYRQFTRDVAMLE